MTRYAPGYTGPTSPGGNPLKNIGTRPGDGRRPVATAPGIPLGAAVDPVKPHAPIKYQPAKSPVDTNRPKMLGPLGSQPKPGTSSNVLPQNVQQNLMNLKAQGGIKDTTIMKNGGTVKKYTKGGKINLDACGISTHSKSKNSSNW